MYSPLLKTLIESFRVLPGVGAKSAQRMAIRLLEFERNNAKHLAETLLKAISEISHCTRCHMLCEMTLCPLCQNPNRDTSLLCVVESPADMIAFEQTGIFSGLYFVLSGHLSPLDGLGPKDIGIDELMTRIQAENISEVILATNPTVEGEVTAQHIASLLRTMDISCSRLAHGIPMGGELEYLDGGTLSQAFHARTAIKAT